MIAWWAVGWLWAAALPSYPGSALVELGPNLRLGGSPAWVGYFSATDAPAAVVGHYVRAWRDEGLPTVVDGRPDELVGSAFDTRRALQRLIVARRQADRTVAFLMERPLAALDEELPQVIPGSTDGVSLGPVEGDGELQQTWWVPRPARDALADVSAALRAEGYQAGAPASAPDARQLAASFVSRDSRILLTVWALAESESLVVARRRRRAAGEP